MPYILQISSRTAAFTLGCHPSRMSRRVVPKTRLYRAYKTEESLTAFPKVSINRLIASMASNDVIWQNIIYFD